MKSIIAAIGSLVIPGLGQLFAGDWFWAAGWFVGGFFFGPLINLFSAGHAFFTVK